MQTLSLPVGAPHATSRAATAPYRHFTRLLDHALAFVRHDRDRWVPLTCAIGFALLSLADWLAA